MMTIHNLFDHIQRYVKPENKKLNIMQKCSNFLYWIALATFMASMFIIIDFFWGIWLLDWSDIKEFLSQYIFLLPPRLFIYIAIFLITRKLANKLEKYVIEEKSNARYNIYRTIQKELSQNEHLKGNILLAMNYLEKQKNENLSTMEGCTVDVVINELFYKQKEYKVLLALPVAELKEKYQNHK